MIANLMTNSNKVAVLAMSAGLTFAVLTPVSAQDAAPANTKSVLATVNGQEITVRIRG